MGAHSLPPPLRGTSPLYKLCQPNQRFGACAYLPEGGFKLHKSKHYAVGANCVRPRHGTAANIPGRRGRRPLRCRNVGLRISGGTSNRGTVIHLAALAIPAALRLRQWRGYGTTNFPFSATGGGKSVVPSFAVRGWVLGGARRKGPSRARLCTLSGRTESVTTQVRQAYTLVIYPLFVTNPTKFMLN